jgi:hypothetical protein
LFHSVLVFVLAESGWVLEEVWGCLFMDAPFALVLVAGGGESDAAFPGAFGGGDM